MMDDDLVRRAADAYWTAYGASGRGTAIDAEDALRAALERVHERLVLLAYGEAGRYLSSIADPDDSTAAAAALSWQQSKLARIAALCRDTEAIASADVRSIVDEQP